MHETFTIKPLSWEPRGFGVSAMTGMGEAIPIFSPTMRCEFWYFQGECFCSEEEAKAAAEADWQRRVRQCLIPCEKQAEPDNSCRQ